MEDILLNIKSRDIQIKDIGSAPILFKSIWGAVCDGDSPSGKYLNIIIPDEYKASIKYTSNRSIIVNAVVPYVDINQSFSVRLVSRNTGGTSSKDYVVFSNTNLTSDLYSAKSYFRNWLSLTTLKACQTRILNINGELKFVLQSGIAYVYSATKSDFNVDISSDQEAQLLALCAPGNMYRFPLTGVGITDYLFSIPQHTNLASKLTDQFKADGKNVSEAEYDSNSGELTLHFTTNTVNENVDVDDNVDMSIFNMSEQAIRNIANNSSDYGIKWVGSDSDVVVYKPNGVTYSCQAIATGNIPGTLSYKIGSGSSYCTIDSATGLVSFSTTKAGATIQVVATFTPDDTTQTAKITIVKTIIYEKGTPNLVWSSLGSTYMVIGDTCGFQASVNTNQAITYKLGGTVVDHDFVASQVGEYVFTAEVAENAIYKSAVIMKGIQIVSESTAVPYYYVGASTATNFTPNYQQIKSGTPYENYKDIVFNTYNKGWRTIWIAVPESSSVAITVLYDRENDLWECKEGSPVTVNGYKVYRWCYMVSLTPTLYTVRQE